MSRYSKKISHKIEKKKQKEQPIPKKPGRDLFLLALIGINFVLLVAGWQQLPAMDKGTYVLMEIALCAIYTQRHREMSSKANDIVKYIGIFSMVAAVVLFLINCYFKYVA